MKNNQLYDNPLIGTVNCDHDGYTYGLKVDNDSQIPPKLSVINDALSFESLSKNKELFHYGTFFTHGNLNVDPFIEFLNRRNIPNTDAGVIVCKQRLLNSGLKSNKWIEHSLAWVSKQWWPELAAWLDYISAINRDTGLFWSVLRQKVPIVDQFALRKKSCLPGRVPMVNIWFYGVTGNHKCVHLVPAAMPPIDFPYIKEDPPEQELVDLGTVLLGEQDKPLDKVQQHG